MFFATCCAVWAESVILQCLNMWLFTLCEFKFVSIFVQDGSEESAAVKALLVNFYESMFPERSQFELPEEKQNQFQLTSDGNKLYAANNHHSQLPSNNNHPSQLVTSNSNQYQSVGDGIGMPKNDNYQLSYCIYGTVTFLLLMLLVTVVLRAREKDLFVSEKANLGINNA